MGNPVLDGASAVAQPGAAITCFYTSGAWIDIRAQDQLKAVATWDGVSEIAAFPDLHPGKYGPVGCAVLADRVYPHLIGNDIGCGMSLFQLDLPQRRFKIDKAARRMRVLGEPLADCQRHRLDAEGLPPDLGPGMLGTIGGGNHFCEVQAVGDAAPGLPLDPDALCLLVHSGSRGVGAAVLADVSEDAFRGLRTPEAAEYIAAHDRAVRWAALNRQIIAERAAEALRSDLRLIADVPHNLLTPDANGWLHRKGAAVASPLVPLAGTRATPSYLLEPLGAEGALASLAHGAGRRHDRSSMHGRVRGRKSDLAAMERNAFGGRLICEDRDLLIEEAPAAYKSAEHVVADLEATGVARRRARLTPLLTFKKTRVEAGR